MEPEIVFFKNQGELHVWFEKNYNNAKELWLGYYKKNSGIANISWQQSVDEALCFGWIDGIRKTIDEKSYKIRFTPRNPKSTWSQVNINKMKEFIKHGLVKPEAIKAFENISEKQINQYSFEQKSISLHENYEAEFKLNKNAWEYFESMPPSYKKPAIWWVMSAKQTETQRKRLSILIHDSEQKQKIAPLRFGKS
jgi:uncharacterized protein YdeI (YjbR/CyaY-like superfamily)